MRSTTAETAVAPTTFSCVPRLFQPWLTSTKSVISLARHRLAREHPRRELRIQINVVKEVFAQQLAVGPLERGTHLQPILLVHIDRQVSDAVDVFRRLEMG